MKRSNLRRLRLIAAFAALSAFSAGQASGIKPYPAAVQPESSFESVERATSGDGRIVGFSVAPSQIEPVSTFFKIHAVDFGLSPEDSIREMASAPDDLGNVVHHFVQFHRGVPVLDSLYILYARDGRVVSGHGNLFPRLRVDVVPKITPGIAVEKGRQSLSKSMTAKYMPVDTRSIRLGLVMHRGDASSPQPRLAYRISDDATATAMDVDASTGEVFQSWRTASQLSPATRTPEAPPPADTADAAGVNAPKEIEEDNVLSMGMTQYDGVKPLLVKKLTDSNTGNIVAYQLGMFRRSLMPGINFWEIPRKIDMPGTTLPDFAAMLAIRTPYDAPSGTSRFDGGSIPQDWYPAISVIYGLQTVHSFVHGAFPNPRGAGGFIGFDGTNPHTYDAYYVSDLLDNALYYATGNYVMFGGGNGTTDGPLVDLDMVAHELGHAILRNAPANAGYADIGDAAAIDEGFGDVFGKIVEFGVTPANFSWSIGHRITIGSAQGVGLRNLVTPSAISDEYGPQPSTAGGPNHYRSFPNGCHLGNDYCAAHHNATIVGHWYFRLVNGGSGTNELGQYFDVFPLGHIAARRIAFLTMQQLGPAPTFDSVRAASLNAARVLFPDPVPGWIKSPEYIATMDAWAAVGVGDRFGKAWDDKYLAIDLTPQSSRTLKDVLTRISLKYGYEGGFQFELSNSLNFRSNAAATPPEAMVASAVAVNHSALPYSAEALWNLKPGTDHYWRATVTSTDGALCAGREAFCAWVLSRGLTTAARRIVPPVLEVHAYLPAHQWAWKEGVEVYYDPVGWMANGDASVSYWLDLAETTSPDFASPVHKAMARGGCDPLAAGCGTFTVTAPKSKTLLARVRAKTDWRDSLFNEVAMAYSDTLEFTTPDVWVRLTGPTDRIRVAPFGNDAVVRMTWATQNVLREPTYEVGSRSITFASNLSSPHYDLDVSTLSGLTDGREYFWTVRASSPSLYAYPYLQPPQSVTAGAVRHFVVDFSLAPRAQGIEPADNASLWACTGHELNLRDFCPIRFSWNSVPRASGYWLHVRQPDGAVQSFDMGTATSKMWSHARVDGSTTGRTYEWWVTTKGPAPNYVSLESTHRRYKVHTITPTVNVAPAHDQTIAANSNAVTFSWTGDPRATDGELVVHDMTIDKNVAQVKLGYWPRFSATVEGVRTPGHKYFWMMKQCPPRPADGSWADCSISHSTHYSVAQQPPTPSSLEFELIQNAGGDCDLLVKDPNGRFFGTADTNHYIEDSAATGLRDTMHWTNPTRGTYVVQFVCGFLDRFGSFSLKARRDGAPDSQGPWPHSGELNPFLIPNAPGVFMFSTTFTYP
jgi:Zn-dependent metalloprotease